MRKFILALTILLSASFLYSGCTGPRGSSVQKIEVGDMIVGYKTSGAGYPLIMIMGFNGTMDLWDPAVLKGLSSKYRVILFDNRGMGETTAGKKEFTIDQFADDAADLIDALGIEKAHVLGWSMGADIALDLAVRHPDKVSKLILYAGDCGGDEAILPSQDVMNKLVSGDFHQALEVLFPEDWFSSTGNRDYIVDLFKSISTESSPRESVQKQAKAMEDWAGVCDRLGEIASPTLLITGDQDIATPTENSIMMAARIPGTWLIQLAEGGHGIMYQYPDRFSENVQNFLRQ
jgi:pimeloyl-ACP methyl ester carboxylesterase